MTKPLATQYDVKWPQIINKAFCCVCVCAWGECECGGAWKMLLVKNISAVLSYWQKQNYTHPLKSSCFCHHAATHTHIYSSPLSRGCRGWLCFIALAARVQVSGTLVLKSFSSPSPLVSSHALCQQPPPSPKKKRESNLCRAHIGLSCLAAGKMR